MFSKYKRGTYKNIEYRTKGGILKKCFKVRK